MSISGVGASNLYALPEASYGTVTFPQNTTAAYDAAMINIAVRPGAIPSQTNSRVAATVVGDYADKSWTKKVRPTVAGTISFNIDSNTSNANLIHKMAGVSTTSQTQDNYSSLISYGMFLPMTENILAAGSYGDAVAGISVKGLYFYGMMVSQYTLSLPNDNSLLDCSLGFIGRNIYDQNLVSAAPTSGTEADWIGAVTAHYDHIPKLGSPFETWTAKIDYYGGEMSVSSVSINIANTLAANNYVTSGDYISKPSTGGRSVTGSFSVPYSGLIGSEADYKNLIDLLKTDSSSGAQKSLTIKLYSSRDSAKSITITMPLVVLMQGQSLNSLSPGYTPMSFSFKAFGNDTSDDKEIMITNAG